MSSKKQLFLLKLEELERKLTVGDVSNIQMIDTTGVKGVLLRRAKVINRKVYQIAHEGADLPTQEKSVLNPNKPWHFDVEKPKYSYTKSNRSASSFNSKLTNNIKDKIMGNLKCPRCKSGNIQLWSNTANIKKVKHSTSININPLKPLTVFNHKEKVKKKKSIKNKELHCNECGHLWKSK